MDSKKRLWNQWPALAEEIKEALQQEYEKGYKQAVADGDAQLQRVIDRLENPSTEKVSLGFWHMPQ